MSSKAEAVTTQIQDAVTPAPVAVPEPNTMSIIVTKGSLDWAYPPFILATTAAAMGLNVTMFFTFYGLPLLLKKLDLKVTAAGNTAMKMPMMGGHMGLPNLVTAIPGVDAACSVMMKNLSRAKVLRRSMTCAIWQLRRMSGSSPAR
jgi:peroxiredoxin family protein